MNKNFNDGLWRTCYSQSYKNEVDDIIAEYPPLPAYFSEIQYVFTNPSFLYNLFDCIHFELQNE